MVFEKTHLLAQAARYQKSGRFGCFGQCGGSKKGGLWVKKFDQLKKIRPVRARAKTKLTSLGPAHKKKLTSQGPGHRAGPGWSGQPGPPSREKL